MPHRFRHPQIALRRPVLLAVAALVAALVLAVPAPARAANDLLNPVVAPGMTGTPSTRFTFRVDYLSTPPQPKDAIRVWAVFEGPSSVPDLQLSLLLPGDARDGTWSGSRTLPLGTWTVEFQAELSDGGSPMPEALPGQIVVSRPATPPPPTPTPRPTATPRPTPTPTPTATPRPTPIPTPLPPGVTPRPTPGATNRPPGTTPLATPSDEASPGATSDSTTSGPAEPTASVDASAGETAGPDASLTSAAPGTDAASPEASASDGAGLRSGFGQMGLVLLGGITSVAGAVVLGRLWVQRRHRLTNGSGDGG